MQPTLSSLMRDSKSVSSGLSKLALNGSTSRPRLASSTSYSVISNSHQNLLSEEENKTELGEQGEDQINAKAEGARPKTPGGTRRPNKLKQGKTMSTSMEIWQIQKELKRGEMVQVRV